jgi:hypothetical protein
MQKLVTFPHRSSRLPFSHSQLKHFNSHSQHFFLEQARQANQQFLTTTCSSFKAKEGGVLLQATSLFSSPKIFKGLHLTLLVPACELNSCQGQLLPGRVRLKF